MRTNETERRTELEALVNVPFKRELDFTALTSLFSHVVKQTGCSANYQKSQYYSIRHGDSKIVPGTLSVEGTFSLYHDSISSAAFTTYNGKCLEKVAGFKFFTPPGYDIDELNEQDREFMKMIKVHVNSF